VFHKTYNHLRPPEMERITVRFKEAGLRPGSRITFSMRGEA
jgi:hypothetical protein